MGPVERRASIDELLEAPLQPPKCVRVDLPFVVAYQAHDAWVALADGTRRSIVERLAHGPLPVGELARELPVSRPAVSQHLKVLKAAGLVCDRAVGTHNQFHQRGGMRRYR